MLKNVFFSKLLFKWRIKKVKENGGYIFGVSKTLKDFRLEECINHIT